MSKFYAKAREDGGLEFPSGFARDKFRAYLKENIGLRLEISPIVPESPRQRAYYHGAVLPMWAFLDGLDYKDVGILEQMHEIAKREFNGEIIVVNGKKQKVGKSSKGLLNSGYLERVIDYLVENYAIDPGAVLNPDQYKYFRDAIFPVSDHEDYIDYLLSTGALRYQV